MSLYALAASFYIYTLNKETPNSNNNLNINLNINLNFIINKAFKESKSYKEVINSIYKDN